MSVVTNIIITTWLEEPGMHRLNAAMNRIKRGDSFNEVSDHCGGTKAMEAHVWLGAFNHLNLDDFWSCMRIADLEYPEDVRVFIQQQEEEHFSPAVRPEAVA